MFCVLFCFSGLLKDTMFGGRVLIAIKTMGKDKGGMGDIFSWNSKNIGKYYYICIYICDKGEKEESEGVGPSQATGFQS